MFLLPSQVKRSRRGDRVSLRLWGLFWMMFFVTPPGTSERLWQIGVFNESSSDLSPLVDPGTGQSKIDYANPAQDPVFVVGKSDSAKDWFPFQPGSSNGKAGHRPHPFTISFNLPEQPSGTYSLKVSLLAYSPRLPVLQVEINGHRGWFYQHPKLSYNAGDPWVFYLPYYSTAWIECKLPLRFLNQGLNKLVLTALDESEDREDSQPNGFPWPGSSGIIYDALSLDHQTETPPSGPQVSPAVVPTIFYKLQENQLVEQVDVFLPLNERPRNSSASLVLKGNKFTQPLVTDREFGEIRLSFQIPDFSPTRAELVVTLNGRRSQSAIELAPARKWNLYVVPNEHLDIGYTDYAPKIAELQSRTIDEAMGLIDQHPEFRFTLDGSWIAEQFLKGRGEAQQQRFFRFVREKKIAVPVNYASPFTGFAGIENLIRSLYFSKRFAQEHGTGFDTALISDVPSYSWSYASVLAAADVKYLLAAVDVYRAPFLLINRFHEQSPQWWEGPDGGRIMTWYSRHYHQMSSLFGMPPRIEVGRESLPRFLQIYDRPSYHADSVILFGTQVENIGLFPEQAGLAEDWNRHYAYPKLQYAVLDEAIAAVTARSAGSFPVNRGDGGPYWEDGVGSNATLVALARENMQRVLSAEKLSTVSSLVNAVVRPDEEVLRNLWRELLAVDEHSWQADRSVLDPESQQSIGQGEIKDAHATRSRLAIDHVLGRAMTAIADFIDAPQSTLVVFNALNWPRDGLVEVDIDKGMAPVDLVTRQPVPYELVSSGKTYRRVRFIAREIPAVGYKSFALQTGAVPPAADPSTETILENTFYRVTLDPASGSVASILDKELNRELVDSSSSYRFNQFLYVSGADELPNRLVQYSTVSPVPDLKIHPATEGKIVSVKRTPLGVMARLASSSLHTPVIESELFLFSNEKRIEFVNRVRKDEVFTKEGVYFAFPFAMDDPRFRYATQTGFVDPAQDLLPGAGREWFSAQQWVAVDQGGFTMALVPIDAPLLTFGDIARGSWPKEFGRRKAVVFSYIMNNYTPEGYLAGQGGEFTFRYVLSSGMKLDPARLSQLGWEAMSPLEVNEIRPNDKPVFIPRTLNANQASFLHVDQPNVVLVTWKIAEDRKGSILRFIETGGKASTVRVWSTLLRLDQAWLCNAVEDNQRPLSTTQDGLVFQIQPFGIATIRTFWH